MLPKIIAWLHRVADAAWRLFAQHHLRCPNCDGMAVSSDNLFYDDCPHGEEAIDARLRVRATPHYAFMEQASLGAGADEPTADTASALPVARQ